MKGTIVKIEYKVISTNKIIKQGKLKYNFPIDNDEIIENFLNDMGMDGWDLVSVTNGNRSGTTFTNTFYFKKIK